MKTMQEQDIHTSQVTITTGELLEHWQGHRRLTRKAIAAFPEDKLFSHSIGGMRSFGEMCLELLPMGAPAAAGLAVPNNWITFEDMDTGDLNIHPKTKKEVLELWDWATDQIDEYWKKVTPERLRTVETAYGQYEGTIWSHLFYLIDNEIHHRGQGYVYLRSLGIEPPFFWER